MSWKDQFSYISTILEKQYFLKERLTIALCGFNIEVTYAF